jgi:hypothetical protein
VNCKESDQINEMDNYKTKQHLHNPILLKKDLSNLAPDAIGFSAAEVSAERVQNFKRDVAVELETLTPTQMFAYSKLMDEADQKCRQLHCYDTDHLHGLWEKWHNVEPPLFTLMTYLKIVAVILMAAVASFLSFIDPTFIILGVVGSVSYFLLLFIERQNFIAAGRIAKGQIEIELDKVTEIERWFDSKNLRVGYFRNKAFFGSRLSLGEFGLPNLKGTELPNIAFASGFEALSARQGNPVYREADLVEAWIDWTVHDEVYRYVTRRYK